MSSRADCCKIKKLEGEIEDLEEANAALKNEIAALEEDLAECEVAVDILTPSEPALLGFAFGVPGPSGTITDSIDTTGADFLVASVITDVPDVMTDFIENGNGWFLVGSSGVSPGPVHEMWICRSPKTSVLHGFRYGTTVAPNATLCVLVFNWGVPPGDPLYIGAFSDAASALSIGPLTHPSSRVVFIAGIGTEQCSPLTVNDGFKPVITAPFDLVLGAHGAAAAYKMVNGPATAHPAWTLNAPGQSAGGLLAFDATLSFAAPPPEAAAWEHWVTQEGPASLNGLVHNRHLTPVSATVGWNAKSVICLQDLPGALNGLNTHFSEPFACVICMVIKRPLAQGQIYISANGSINDPTGTGLMVRETAPDAMTLFAKTVAPGDTTTLAIPWSDIGTGVAINVGEWVFVAYICDAANPHGWVAPSPQANGILENKIDNSRPVVIGNGYHAAIEAGQQLEVAEVIIFNDMLPFSELTAVYQRSKLRMAEKGITIAGSLVL